MLYDNILMPYDGSASARSALAEVVRYAKEDPGLVLRIIQIIDTEQLVIDKLEPPSTRKTGELSSAELKKIRDEVIEEASAQLHKETDSMLSGLMNKIYIELLEETSPGDQIVAYATQNKCDLIVMGSRGLGALRGMLGSVSNFVLRNASAPVLIVKQGDIQ